MRTQCDTCPRERSPQKNTAGKELFDILRYPGFQASVKKYWSQGVKELYRSHNKSAFLRQAQKLIPAISASDATPAVSGYGALLDDFAIRPAKNGIHTPNAPSPAATSALRIATTVLDTLNRLDNNSPARMAVTLSLIRKQQLRIKERTIIYRAETKKHLSLRGEFLEYTANQA